MKALQIISAIILINLSHSCVYIPSSECPSIEGKCRCGRTEGPNNTSVVICCNITSEFLFKESRTCAGLLTNVTHHVVMYNSLLEYFNASLPEWHNLTSLTLTNNTIKRIRGTFKGNLSCVNLSGNSLIDIEPHALKSLTNLTILDLSHNNITQLPIFIEIPNNTTNSSTVEKSKSNTTFGTSKTKSSSKVKSSMSLKKSKPTSSSNHSKLNSSSLDTPLSISEVNGTNSSTTATVAQRNLTLDISGNPQLQCQSVVLLMNNSNRNGSNINVKFINRNATYCLASQSFHWFNSTSSVSLEQLELLQGLTEKCEKILYENDTKSEDNHHRCNCGTHWVEMVAGNPLKIGIKVDCSGQRLVDLPSKLPPNTVHLDVSNNNITSLDRLISDSIYSDIRELLADNNKITSITSLERSQFIDKLTILSIRNNELKSIPIYILSNTFDRNMEEKYVKLGGNKLNCDCNTAQVLKLWLLANKGHIPDYNEVLCEKHLERVINLDQNKVCVYQKDWTDYIYYIIAAEVILLLLLISKVTYDYWVFKTSGYLPWPASKMPKLPCDWVFET